MANGNIEKAVGALIDDKDNVGFMKHMKDAMYAELAEHPEYQKLSDEIEMYSKKSEDEPEDEPEDGE